MHNIRTSSYIAPKMTRLEEYEGTNQDTNGGDTGESPMDKEPVGGG